MVNNIIMILKDNSPCSSVLKRKAVGFSELLQFNTYPI